MDDPSVSATCHPINFTSVITIIQYDRKEELINISYLTKMFHCDISHKQAVLTTLVQIARTTNHLENLYVEILFLTNFRENGYLPLNP